MRLLLLAQGIYYLLTGLWPLVHLPSFEAVTGPKTDDWLVHMVGTATVAVGSTLIVGARGARPSLETRWLAVWGAAAYAAIDFVYGLSGRIRFVYVMDGFVQVAIIAFVLWFWFKSSSR